MKRLWVPLTAILTVLSLAGLAFAQAKPAEPAKPAESAKPEAQAEKPAESAKPAIPAEKPAKLKRVTGEVVSADPVAKTLTIRINKGEVTYTVTEKAAKVLADLKPGDKVTIRLTEMDGKRTAQAITKAKAPIKAQKPAKEETAAPMAPAKPAEPTERK